MRLKAFNRGQANCDTLEKVFAKRIRSKRQVVVDGVPLTDHLGNSFLSLKEAARQYGLSATTLSRRLKAYQNGDVDWSTLEQVFTTPVTKRRRSFTDHLGNTFSTMKEAATYHGLKKRVLQSRLEKYDQSNPKWDTLEKVFTTPTKKS